MAREKSSANPTLTCHVHPSEQAVYLCRTCATHLCENCVTQDAHLLFCSNCNNQAERIPTIMDDPASLKETLAETTATLQGLALAITNHIVVPVALIAMVTAVLFYLLDIRSVYLDSGDGLKQIGFFFAVATVLIARYGKIHAVREKQSMYTGALAVATVIAMMRQPGNAGLGTLVNLVIVALVWWFATGISNKLDLVEVDDKPDEHQLYGVERIQHQEIERKYKLNYNLLSPLQQQQEKIQASKKHKPIARFLSGQDLHGNPAAPAAKLSALAVLIFALGEPALLAGPPEIGLRAFAAVVVFMLSAGVVLAAASTAGTFRTTLEAGGKPSPAIVPIRIFLAVLLMVVVLSAGLMVPGLNYKGSGNLQPTGQSDGSNKSGSQTNKKPSNQQQDRKGNQGQQGTQRQSQASEPQGRSALQTLFNFFATIGKWLLPVLIILFICFILYALFKILPILKESGAGLKERLRQWLARLRGLLRFSGGEKKVSETLPNDPSYLLAGLSALTPRDTVLTAYKCLSDYLERAGHKRIPRLTASEYLGLLPEHLAYLSVPARRLTELYVGIAYSPRSPETAESQAAQEAINEVRQLLTSRS